MVVQGLIDTRAFSLDLREIESPDGSIIFGGLDTGKYVGSLEKCPMLDPEESPTGSNRYWIYLNAVGMTLPSGESGLIADGELPVFLDSGGTLSRLPTELFASIGSAFPGAQYDSYEGAFVVDCSVAEEEGSVDFGFGNKVISVPFKDFIWQPGTDEDVCMLGILPDDGKPRSFTYIGHYATADKQSRRASPRRLLPPRCVRCLRPRQPQPPPRPSRQLRVQPRGLFLRRGRCSLCRWGLHRGRVR